MAESTDLISDLDDFVMREACQQAASWREELPHGEEFTVSVNVSERRLADPGLSGKIAQAIADARLPASSLCLEIAERAVMDRRAAALIAIPDLEQLGIRLLIDDFGIAISSFGSLNRLPRLNAIKIDASFIAGLGRSREDSAGVAAIIGLAHGLELTATGRGDRARGPAPRTPGPALRRRAGLLLRAAAASRGARRAAQLGSPR